jgi:hypothetical protein
MNRTQVMEPIHKLNKAIRNEITSGAKIPVSRGATQSTSSEDGLKSTQSAQKLVETIVRAHVLVVRNQQKDVSLGHPIAEIVPLTLHPPSRQ